jgi:uncharacterized protein involved in exopolysaccharide biosynthesis
MRYLRTFSKYWYLYFIPVLIVPLIMTVLGYRALMLYQSSALIYVDQPVYLTLTNANPYLTPAQNQAESMAELLQSETFDSTIAAQTDLTKTIDLSTQGGRGLAFVRITQELSVVPTGTGPNTIILTATDKDPYLAQQVVQAALTDFTNYFTSHRVQLDQQGIAFYEQQLASAQGQLTQDSAKLADYLNRHPGEAISGSSVDAALASLEEQVSQDQSSVTTLQSQIENLRSDASAASAGTATFLRVLDQPQVPLRPTLALRKLATSYTLVGFVGAAGFDAAIIVLLTLLDRKVYFADDLRRVGDEMEMEGIRIEKLPSLTRIGRAARQHVPLANSGSSTLLTPVIAALPQLHTRVVPEVPPGATD